MNKYIVSELDSFELEKLRDLLNTPRMNLINLQKKINKIEWLEPKKWPLIKGIELHELINQNNLFFEYYDWAYEHIDHSDLITCKDYEIEQSWVSLLELIEDKKIRLVIKTEHQNIIKDLKKVLKHEL